MRKSVTLLGLLAVCSTLAMACSQSKQLEEMHDSTASMDKTTQSMDTNMDDLNGKMGGMGDRMESMDTTMGSMDGKMSTMTDGMTGLDEKMGGMSRQMEHMDGQMTGLSKVTSGLCRGSSQALPLQARQATLIQMDRALTAQDKINWAVTYVQGFDFQAWPLCNSTQTEIDLMIDDAVLELFQMLHRFDSGRKMPNPFLTEAADRDDNDAKDIAFNVLGVSLGFANRLQLENRISNPKAPVYTFLSIIEETLAANRMVELGKRDSKTLKQYQIDILANKAMALRVLQARQSLSVAIVVGFAKDVKSPGIGNLIELARNRYLSGITGGVQTWTFEIDQWNVGQLRRYTRFLNEALETRKFLKRIGVEPVLNPNLRALFSGMTPKFSGQKNASLTKERVAFMTTLKALQAHK